jgi:hypothetical protein
VAITVAATTSKTAKQRPAPARARQASPAPNRSFDRDYLMACPEVHDSETQRDREARAAKIQVMFREINERVKELADGFIITPDGDWICECANDSCVERIEMSVNEYESVRRYGARFFVAPSDEHLLPDVDRVIIARNNRYWVIEQIGRAGDLAKRSDPRSHRGPLTLRT